MDPSPNSPTGTSGTPRAAGPDRARRRRALAVPAAARPGSRSVGPTSRADRAPRRTRPLRAAHSTGDRSLLRPRRRRRPGVRRGLGRHRLQLRALRRPRARRVGRSDRRPGTAAADDAARTAIPRPRRAAEGRRSEGRLHRHRPDAEPAVPEARRRHAARGQVLGRVGNGAEGVGRQEARVGVRLAPRALRGAVAAAQSRVGASPTGRSSRTGSRSRPTRPIGSRPARSASTPSTSATAT